MSELPFFLHLTGMAVAIVGILRADHLAFHWWRGTHSILSLSSLRQIHYFVGIALLLLIGSGLYMFYPRADYLLNQPLFLLKLTFVVGLVINSFVIGRLMAVATTRSFESLSKKELTPLFISGVVSVLGWIGAAMSALVLFN